MKKKIAAVLCAALAFVALPAALAFGAPTYSEAGASDTTTGSNGVAASVTCTNSGNGWIKVESSTQLASNVPADADVIASFEITSENTQPPYNFTYTLGAEYAGATVTVYIEHGEDGSTEVITKTAGPDGSISFSTDKLSIHTIVAKKATGSVTTDTGSKSPQTGLSGNAAAVAGAVAAVAAAGVAVALHKKVSA